VAPFFSSDLQLTRHPGLSQFSAIRQVLSLAHHPRHPTKTIPSSTTIPSCASSRSMYLLCLIKISYRISYRIYFCLSRWNAVPSTSHLSCYSFPPSLALVQHAHCHSCWAETAMPSHLASSSERPIAFALAGNGPPWRCSRRLSYVRIVTPSGI
jgi:hypothetical protein